MANDGSGCSAGWVLPCYWKKDSNLGRRQPSSNLSGIVCPAPEGHMPADRLILSRGAVLAFCVFVSHRNLQNKREFARVAQ